MHGYGGRILRVNLSTSQISVQEMGADLARRTIGGRGLAAEILLTELRADVDPLGADNKLLFATGPLQSTRMPGGTRAVLCAKSPITGGWGETHAAGSIGPALTRAGYDAVVIEGKAATPVYLMVSGDQVALRDARSLWGQTVGNTIEAIRAQTSGKAEVAAIGCAGENLVRYAAVISDYDRAFGRSGLGAVMGAKGLKAIAVHGGQRAPLADEERARELVKEAVAQTVAGSARLQAMSTYGTAGGVDFVNMIGSLPVNNYQEGYSDDDLVANITGQGMGQKGILGKNTGCVGCALRCHLHASVESSPYGPVNPKYGGPEFETIGLLGSNLGIFDPVFIVRANELCNEHGLDTMSAGGIMGWAFECYERGYITKQDTGGLELKWGNGAAALELLNSIIHRQGIGDLLADGFQAAIPALGQETAAFAMHVKYHPFAAHMPRARIGQGLNYAVSNRGACHLQGIHDTTIEGGRIAPELGIGESFKGLSRLSKEHKAGYEFYAQNWRALQDCLIVCKFTVWDYGHITPEVVIGMLNAATGCGYSIAEALWVGERAWNACRLFNLRAGFTRQDDTLPDRCAESMTRGHSQGSVITRADLDKMLDEYYAMRGWDADGVPAPDTLARLELPAA